MKQFYSKFSSSLIDENLRIVDAAKPKSHLLLINKSFPLLFKKIKNKTVLSSGAWMCSYGTVFSAMVYQLTEGP